MNALIGAVDFPPVSHLLEWPDFLFKGTALGINKVVLLTLIGAGLTVAFFWVAGRKQAVVPTGAQNMGEMAVEFVERDIVINVMGPEARHWTPFLTSIFFLILVLNLLGLVPVAQMPVNSRMALPMYLALQTWLLMIIVGFKHQGFKFISNTLFPPGLPGGIGGALLKGLLAFIELLSVFILRPFTLMVRLFANLLAGHMLLTTFYVLSSALLVKSFVVVILPAPIFMSIFVTAFEVLVAVLQAYIFSILTAVYIGESMHGH